MSEWIKFRVEVDKRSQRKYLKRRICGMPLWGGGRVFSYQWTKVNIYQSQYIPFSECPIKNNCQKQSAPDYSLFVSFISLQGVESFLRGLTKLGIVTTWHSLSLRLLKEASSPLCFTKWHHEHKDMRSEELFDSNSGTVTAFFYHKFKRVTAMCFT